MQQPEPSPRLTFSPGDHVYKWDGAPVVSTTQVIEAQHGFCDTWYMERGKKGHKAIELYRNGVLEEETLDNQLKPYLEAYKRFEADAPHVCGVIDIKLGQPQKWHLLQIAAYVNLCQNGVDEWGVKLIEGKLSLSEMRLFDPVYHYSGTIDIIHVDWKEGHILYLRDDETYRLQSVDRLFEKKKQFMTLVSAYHIRRTYGI